MPFLISILCYGVLLILGKVSIGSYTYDFGFIRCVAGFYSGILIYRFKKNTTFRLAGNINSYEALSVLLLFLLLSFSPDLSLYYDLLIIGSFALIIFVFSEKQNGIIGKLLNSRILKTIGKYSYSIYMLHVLVISLCGVMFKYLLKIDPSSINGMTSVILNLLICAIIILLSKFSYQYIESYFREKSRAFVHGKLNYLSNPERLQDYNYEKIN
jgi:peptidoglycan/LPS O-acetylase OafA/YrhL